MRRPPVPTDRSEETLSQKETVTTRPNKSRPGPRRRARGPARSRGGRGVCHRPGPGSLCDSPGVGAVDCRAPGWGPGSRQALQGLSDREQGCCSPAHGASLPRRTGSSSPRPLGLGLFGLGHFGSPRRQQREDCGPNRVPLSWGDPAGPAEDGGSCSKRASLPSVRQLLLG